MGYSSVSLETLAINALEKAILQSELLQPFLKSNDRTPLWDGEVFVYRSKGIRNNDLFGVVRIQVKSKRYLSHPRHSKRNFSIELPVDDLKNYLLVGGTILFHVALFDNEDVIITYRSLLPVDIVELLNSCKPNQSKKTIDMKYFPHTDGLNVLSIFSSFLHDYNNQSALKKQINTPKTIDSDMYKDAMSQSNEYFVNLSKEELRARYPTPDLFTREFVRRMSEPYIYKQINDELNIKIPLAKINKMQVVFTDTKFVSVMVGGTEYYKQYVAEYSEGLKRVRFGKGLWFVEESGGKAFPYDMYIEGTLNERINDISFLFDLFQQGYYKYLNHSVKVYVNSAQDEFAKFMTQIRGRFLELKAIRELYNTIGKTDDVDVDAFSDQEMRMITAISKGLLYNNPVSLMDDEIKAHPEFSYRILTIKGLNFLIKVQPCGKDNEYHISSLQENTLISGDCLIHFISIIREIGISNFANASPKLISTIIHNGFINKGASGIFGITLNLDQNTNPSEFINRVEIVSEILHKSKKRQANIFKNWLNKIGMRNMSQEVIDEVLGILESDKKEVGNMLPVFENLKNEGKLQGKIEGKIEDATNMLLEGLDIKLITKITGLSLEKVLEIKKNTVY